MAKAGSITLGVFVGIIMMVIIGWIPLIGALIAGLVAGAIARGARRGLVVGFLSGLIGLLILIFLASAMGSAIAGAVGIGGIILVAIGGLMGGAFRHRETEKLILSEKKQKHSRMGNILTIGLIAFFASFPVGATGFIIPQTFHILGVVLLVSAGIMFVVGVGIMIFSPLLETPLQIGPIEWFPKPRKPRHAPGWESPGDGNMDY